MPVSEIFSNHLKELVSRFWKMFSAYTKRMARLKTQEKKIPTEIYIIMMSSQ